VYLDPQFLNCGKEGVIHAFFTKNKRQYNYLIEVGYIQLKRITTILFIQNLWCLVHYFYSGECTFQKSTHTQKTNYCLLVFSRTRYCEDYIVYKIYTGPIYIVSCFIYLVLLVILDILIIEVDYQSQNKVLKCSLF